MFCYNKIVSFRVNDIALPNQKLVLKVNFSQILFSSKLTFLNVWSQGSSQYYTCGFFAETVLATTHHHDIILHAVWKKRMWVTTGSFRGKGEWVVGWKGKGKRGRINVYYYLFPLSSVSWLNQHNIFIDFIVKYSLLLLTLHFIVHNSDSIVPIFASVFLSTFCISFA